MVKILLVSFSSTSTGEISYIKSALLNNSKFLSFDIFVNEKFIEMASGFSEKIFTHQCANRNYITETFRKLKKLAVDYHWLIFLDLNSFFLELNLGPRDLKKLLKLFLYFREINVLIGVNDTLSAIEISERSYMTRRAKLEIATEQMIGDVVKKDYLKHDKIRGGFFSKFIASRIYSQLFLLPDYVHVFRPCPINYPKTVSIKNIFYYKIFSETIKQSNIKSRKILIALSGFFTRILEPEIIRHIIQHSFQLLVQYIKIDEILVIDPNNIFENSFYIKTTKINKLSRMSRNDLIRTLSIVGFVGTYTPYSSIGPICMANSIPFVYFTNSRFLSDLFKDNSLFSNLHIPPFRSLGWWEDIAYYDYIKDQNPYFHNAFNLDIGDETSFQNFSEYLSNKKPGEKLREWKKDFDFLDIKTLPEHITGLL